MGRNENLFVLGVELLRNVGFLVHGYTNAMRNESTRERKTKDIEDQIGLLTHFLSPLSLDCEFCLMFIIINEGMVAKQKRLL